MASLFLALVDDIDVLFEPERGPRFAIYEHARKFELQMVERDGRIVTSPMRLDAVEIRKLGQALVAFADLQL